MDYFHLSHSGARLWRDGNLVFKRGAVRLRNSAQKQQAHASPWLSAPKVIEVEVRDTTVTLVQQWIDGRLPLASKLDAVLATGAAAAYVLGNQAPHDVSTAPMVARLLNVTETQPALVQEIAHRLEALGTIPGGRTHGDLTFCNMLVRDEHVYAVDFSDVTVESPLLDAVKLRQDTFHGWAARLTDVNPLAVAQADEQLDWVFGAALRGYAQSWRTVSAWSLLCRVFTYGNASTRAWAEEEAWRCIRSY